jgi:excinuclease ABC subunit A
LVEGGASVLIIEHNLDIIKSADWVIDLGPEGGEAGGRVIAAGTPEQVARNNQSHTGKFLARVLNNNHSGQNHANHSAIGPAPASAANDTANAAPRNSVPGK